jgi:hypothetical protein
LCGARASIVSVSLLRCAVFIECTSSWLTGVHERNDMLPGTFAHKIAPAQIVGLHLGDLVEQSSAPALAAVKMLVGSLELRSAILSALPRDDSRVCLNASGSVELGFVLEVACDSEANALRNQGRRFFDDQSKSRSENSCISIGIRFTSTGACLRCSRSDRS